VSFKADPPQAEATDQTGEYYPIRLHRLRT